MSPNVPIIVDTINNADQALEQDENDKNSEKTIHCKDGLPIEAMDTPLKPSLFCPGFQRNSSQVQIQCYLLFGEDVQTLAGAGSGKTHVITYRIAYLIENRKVRPDQILAVTFTNKAAEQMMQRVYSLLRAGRSSNPAISTFHSFCGRVLRRDIPAIGYGRDFTIYDDTDQLSLVKNCLKEMGLDEKLLSARYALSRVSYAKNHGLTPEAVYQQAYDAKTEKIAVAFGLYEK